jgi:acetyl esterase/lipase
MPAALFPGGQGLRAGRPWRSHRGAAKAGNQQPPISSAWISIGTLDHFYEGNVSYAHRLRAAGVPCELDVVEGAYHGFDGAAKGAPESIAFANRMIDALRMALQAKELSLDTQPMRDVTSRWRASSGTLWAECTDAPRV